MTLGEDEPPYIIFYSGADFDTLNIAHLTGRRELTRSQVDDGVLRPYQNPAKVYYHTSVGIGINKLVIVYPVGVRLRMANLQS